MSKTEVQIGLIRGDDGNVQLMILPNNEVTIRMTTLGFVSDWSHKFEMKEGDQLEVKGANPEDVSHG